LIRVLIADDQPLIRSGLRSILEREDDIDVVGEAATVPRRHSTASRPGRSSGW